MRRAPLLPVLGCALVVLASCFSSPAATEHDPDDPAVLTYGYGPSAESAAVYQPDVVLIESGPNAVRSASANGLVWTMDGSAPGMAELAVGKIMFATSKAVGRVVALRDVGDDRVVTLGPVDFTDVVRDADITIEEDLEDVVVQHVPDLPGAMWEPRPTGGGSAGQAGGDSDAMPEAERAGSITVPVDAWKVKISKGNRKVGVNVSRGKGLKADLGMTFTGADIKVQSGLAVRGGTTTKSGFLLSGIDGLRIDLSAGAPGGSVDNEKAVIELPVSFNVPVPPSPATAGLPLNLKVAFKVSVSTAITGKNSTIFASGAYKLSGPIGITAGEVQAPTFEVERSLMESLRGIQLGPSGIVVAMKLEAGVGIGTPAVQAGPYGMLITSVGLTRGSTLGAPLVQCSIGTLKVTAGGGVGVEMSPGLLDELKKFLPAGTKVELKAGIRKDVLERHQTIPESAACG